jgi:hypothetical protein
MAAVSLTIACSFASAQDTQNTQKRGRKYKSPPATARVEVTILRDTDAKPIENAAVIFHPMVGGKDEGNMELKTNEDGKTVIDVLPIGDSVRLQIIAKGFKTYGQDYKVDKAEMTIQVRMKRPGEQYSIYKDHSGESSDNPGGTNQPADKPADQPKQNPPSSQPPPSK